MPQDKGPTYSATEVFTSSAKRYGKNAQHYLDVLQQLASADQGLPAIVRLHDLVPEFAGLEWRYGNAHGVPWCIKCNRPIALLTVTSGSHQVKMAADCVPSLCYAPGMTWIHVTCGGCHTQKVFRLTQATLEACRKITPPPDEIVALLKEGLISLNEARRLLGAPFLDTEEDTAARADLSTEEQKEYDIKKMLEKLR